MGPFCFYNQSRGRTRTGMNGANTCSANRQDVDLVHGGGWEGTGRTPVTGQESYPC